MKEQDVEKLAALLNKSQEEVNTALENGGISDFINEFESGHEIYTKSDFDKFKTNYEAQVEQKWQTGKVPKTIYDKIKGTVLEMTEKQLAEKYGVSDFTDIDDLVSKIKPAKNPSEDVKVYKDQIDNLTREYEAKLKEEADKNDKRFINSQLNQLINAVPIDAEGKVLEAQRKVLKTLVLAEFDFGVEADALRITNAPVEFKQKNLDPKPPLDVVIDFAKDYVSLSSSAGGGRGDISSTARTSKVNFPEYCKKNGISPNTVEHAEALKKFKAEGVELEY